MLEIAFLDIGQGDCAVVTFPNGHTMLVDAGGEPFAKFDTGRRVVLPYLRWRRIKRLDTVVMSHPHPDHFGGFPSVMRALPVGEFWHTGEKGGHRQYRALQKVLKERKIRQRLFPKRWSTDIGGVKVDVLHPFPGPYEGKTFYWALDANDNSLVLRLRYGQRTILLLGDVEERGEELMVERYGQGLRADVIKVAHHGSRTSSTELFLKTVRPRHAVMSLGRRNIFGFPHPEVKARYKRRKIRVWRTDRHGRILLKTDGRGLWMSTRLPASQKSR
jgi:competence protein ComEC